MGIMSRVKKFMKVINGTLLREMHGDEEMRSHKYEVYYFILIFIMNPKLIWRLVACKTTNHMWPRLSTIYKQNVIVYTTIATIAF